MQLRLDRAAINRTAHNGSDISSRTAAQKRTLMMSTALSTVDGNERKLCHFPHFCRSTPGRGVTTVFVRPTGHSSFFPVMSQSNGRMMGNGMFSAWKNFLFQLNCSHFPTLCSSSIRIDRVKGRFRGREIFLNFGLPVLSPWRSIKLQYNDYLLSSCAAASSQGGGGGDGKLTAKIDYKERCAVRVA